MHTEHGHDGETEIVHRAYETLRPLLVPEASFRTSVSEIALRVVRFARARSRIERRAIERRRAPAPRGQRADAEPVITPALDPWLVERASLPTATRQLCVCDACEGAARRRCTTCEGAGLIETWLEVVSSERAVVHADPEDVARHFLPEALSAEDFERTHFLHRLEGEDYLEGDELSLLADALRPTLESGERVREVHVQRFAAEVHDVRYQTALGTGTVELAGAPLRAFGVVRAPVVRRNFAAVCAFLLGAGVSAGAALLYRAQHPWHARYGEGGALLALGLLASALLGAALLGWLRAKAQRTPLSTWCPTLAASALAIGAGALVSSAQPSLVEAHAALVAGDLLQAELSADALASEASDGAGAGSLAALRDDIRLARMQEARDLEAKLALALAGPWSSTRRPRMQALLQEALSPREVGARRADDVNALVRLSSAVEPVLPEKSRALSIDAAAVMARTCLEHDDTGCAQGAAQVLREMGAHELSARVHGRLITRFREQLDEVLAETTRARSPERLREHLTKAARLCTELSSLGSPAPKPTCLVVTHALARGGP